MQLPVTRNLYPAKLYAKGGGEASKSIRHRFRNGAESRY